MASPVDTTVKFMTSDMTGAIQGISGAAGGFNNALKQFLVTGWDVITPTSIVVSGGIATVTFPSTHSAIADSVILIAGATPAGLNGEQKIVTKTATNMTFATAEANTTATGTITVRMAPCGWAETFTGTNTSVYRAATGNRMFLRVIDTGTTDCRVIGYENMTAVAAGTGLFPTTAQLSGGYYWNKAPAATATLAPYMFFGDGTRFYVAVASNFSTDTTYQGMYLSGFGDFRSWRVATDAYSAFLHGGDTALAWPPTHLGQMGFTNSTVPVMVAARLHTNAAGAVNLDWLTESADTGMSGAGVKGPYPGITDSLFLSKPVVSNNLTLYGPRGEMPGIWQIPQTLPTGSFSKGDIVVGAGETAGKRLAVVPTVGGSSTIPNGSLATLIDVTGPW